MLPYLAGLVAGDGHIEKGGRIVVVSTEKPFLETIGSFVPYKNSIFHDKRAGVWKIAWNSKQFTRDMELIGLKRGDKTTVAMSLKLQDCQLPQFIAGVYDAEGHFELDKRSGTYFRIRIKMKNSSVMRLVYQFLKGNGYEPRKFNKDDCIAVDINKQKHVARFASAFMLFHPKWGRLISAFRDRRPKFPGVTRGLQCAGQWVATP